MANLHILDQPRGHRSTVVRDIEAIEAAIERVLGQLAEIGNRYECECGMIEGALHPRPWKEWRLERLRLKYENERMPLVQLLMLLNQELESSSPTDWTA